MTTAPEPIFRAANDTISWACIFCRNQTLNKEVSVKMLNEIMEAIHEVPRMVVNWDRHDLAEIRLHLSCFQSGRWQGAPDLLGYFNQKLKEFGWTEQ